MKLRTILPAFLCLFGVFSCTLDDNGPKTATSVVLNKDNVNIMVGESVTLTATVLPEKLKMGVTWQILDPKIASCDKGVVKGLSEGVTYAVATSADGNRKTSCMVSVNPPSRYRVILKDEDGNVVKSLSSYPGFTQKLYVSTSDGVGSHTFTWKVEDGSVASATANGTVSLKAVSSTNPDYVYYGQTNLVVTTEDEGCGCTIPLVSSVCKGITVNGKYFPGSDPVMIPSKSSFVVGVNYGAASDNLYVPKDAFSLSVSNTANFSIDSSGEDVMLVAGDKMDVSTSLLISMAGVDGIKELVIVKTEKSAEIKDYATLKEYLEKVAAGTAPAMAEVSSDIALTSTQAESLPSPAGFNGALDGKNHTISGLAAPLFASMTDDAAINNLKLTVDITSSSELVGAFAGEGNKANLTNCTVNGSITISGVNAENLNVGGFFGKADGVFKNCVNNASIEVESGSISADASIGGIVAYGNFCSFDKCRNTGAITMSVETSGGLQIGGIVSGDIENAMDGCSNAGPIKVEANVGGGLYIGGVVGFTRDLAPLSNLINEETGSISCAAISMAKQMYIGGVIGGERDEVEVTHTKLINYAPITLGESTSSQITSGSKSYSYIGGVSGGNGSTRTTYVNCENYGDITYYGQPKCRCGGVVSYSYNDLVQPICKANIRFVSNRKGTESPSDKSDVGGIAGYLNTTTVTGYFYKGDLNTNSSSPRAYTGGIVGRHQSNACTFTNCKVGGSIKGAGSAGNGTDNCVALMCCAGTKHEINFVGCVVDTAMKRYSTTITNLTLNYSSKASDGPFVAGTTSATGTTLLDPATTGTMTNCIISSIE